MIIFLLFISFWLGLSISKAWVALLIVTIVFLLFVFKRFSKLSFSLCLLTTLIGFGLSFVKLNSSKNISQGLVYVAKENYVLLNSGGERLYVAVKNNTYDIGDILTVEGKKEELSFVTLESSFDFNEYLNKRGIYYSITPTKVTVNYHHFIRLKERREKLLSMFKEEQRSIVGSILFSDGDSSDLTSDIRELHLARFLSASGVFISAFYYVFRKLLGFIMKDKYAEISSIGVLSLYTIFTFPRFSVIKVMTLLLVKWINTYPLKGKFSYLSILGGTGLFFLILNRYLAFQDGFILGYLIPIISYLTRYIGSRKKITRRLTRYLIIYLLFVPFEINYYNKIVILSLPLQVLSTPLFILIGIVSLLCFFYVPIYEADKFLISILSKYVNFIKPLSFGLYFPSLNQILILIYYLIFFFFLYYSSHDFVPLKRAFLMGQVSFLIVLALPIKNAISEEVNFISVGQGDCTLIRSHQKVALIDTGGLTYKDIANDVLIPYLRKKQIYKIDMVIITHYDYDHYGALEGLSKAYRINQVVDYYSSFPVSLGNITFNNYNYYGMTSSEENDKSLVLSFSACNKDFVVMGDAPKSIEREIIKSGAQIPCDVLRVGHHGSNTSTSEEWVKYLNPQEAVISVGKNNKFGHPNKEVISVLNKYKIRILRTDQIGTINYKAITL